MVNINCNQGDILTLGAFNGGAGTESGNLIRVISDASAPYTSCWTISEQIGAFLAPTGPTGPQGSLLPVSTATGSVLYSVNNTSPSGAWLSPGATGSVLTSNGPTSIPSYTSGQGIGVRLNRVQNVANTTVTTPVQIQYNQVLYNTFSNTTLNTTTGLVTVGPSDGGLFLVTNCVSFSVTLSTDAKFVSCVFVNGVEYAQTSQSLTSRSDDPNTQCTAVVNLPSGGTIAGYSGQNTTIGSIPMNQNNGTQMFIARLK